MTVFHPYRSGNWRGVVHHQWQEPLQNLDQWLRDNPGTTVIAKKARTVSRVETPNGVLYVKVLHRLQEKGPAWKMLLTGSKWFLRPSRAIAVFKITSAMLDKGIGCPEPVLAARRRNAIGWPEDVFICREVPYPTLLSLFYTADKIPARDALIANAAHGIAALHNQGFVHGDCLPGNLCLAPDQSIVFLDNDRTQPMPLMLRRRARLNNVVQFLSRLPQSTQQSDVFALFLDTYRQDSATTCPISAKCLSRLAQKLQHRLALLAAKRARKNRVQAQAQNGRH